MQAMTVKDILEAKGAGRRLVMLTAYDAPTAALVDGAGADMVLVGDSLGMVLLGYDSTVPVTMDEMLHHCRAASRGRRRALLVGDMPFGAYQISDEQAIGNAIRFLKEGGCDAVKLEGGADLAPRVAAMVRAGVPVMGHVGLTPQTAGQLGGYKVQGRDLASARRLLEDARALDRAGVFALVLECVPGPLAGLITRQVSAVTIGIGAGPECDGQVLVTHDLLGMTDRKPPTFVKPYAGLRALMEEGVARFVEDVGAGRFPGPAQTFGRNMDVAALAAETEERSDA